MELLVPNILSPADQWARRKGYIEANGGKEACGIPVDYPYAELLDDFK